MLLDDAGAVFSASPGRIASDRPAGAVAAVTCSASAVAAATCRWMVLGLELAAAASIDGVVTELASGLASAATLSAGANRACNE